MRGERSILVDVSALVVLGLLVGALAVTRVSGFVLRRAVRHMAERARVGLPSSWWRTTASRGALEGAAAGETRRRQRVDAAARMLNHLVAVLVWIAVTIAAFHVLGIDAAFFLSSAGFIGAGLAIGGQHKVNDYLTGLSVLFEDRYCVGDELVVERGDGTEEVHAVVDHIGLFTTRLRDRRGTLHIPNSAVAPVRNISQEPQETTLRLRLDEDSAEPVSEQFAASSLKRLAGTENLTEVFFVGDLDAHRRHDGDIDVSVRTVRPLDPRAKAVLVDRAEASLRAGG